MSYSMKLKMKGFKQLDNEADCYDAVSSFVGAGVKCKVWVSNECPISFKSGYEELDCTLDASNLLFGVHKLSFNPLFCDVLVFIKEDELNVRLPVGYKGEYRYYRFVKI